MGRVCLFPPWIWTWSHDLFWSIAYEYKCQLASSKRRHEKSCVSICILALLPLPWEKFWSLGSRMNTRRPKLPRSVLRIAGETKPSSKAQPRSSEPHPAHIGVSNNKWSLLEDPEFGGGLLGSSSELIHFTSRVPMQNTSQWQDQVMTPALWLNYMTCFAQMLARALCEHCPG